MIGGAVILVLGVGCWILAAVIHRHTAAAVVAATVTAAVLTVAPSADAMPPGPGMVPVAPVTADPGTRPACRWDDGSGTGRRPCVWDARHLGNGLGDSFLAIPVYPFRGADPVIRYLSHRRAHRLLFGAVR